MNKLKRNRIESAICNQQGHKGLKIIVVQIIDVTVVRNLTFKEGYWIQLKKNVKDLSL